MPKIGMWNECGIYVACFFHFGKWQKPQQTFTFARMAMQRTCFFNLDIECIKRAKDVLLPTINGSNARSYRSCAGCTFLTACRPESFQEVAKRKRLLLMDVNILYYIINY